MTLQIKEIMEVKLKSPEVSLPPPRLKRPRTGLRAIGIEIPNQTLEAISATPAAGAFSRLSVLERSSLIREAVDLTLPAPGKNSRSFVREFLHGYTQALEAANDCHFDRATEIHVLRTTSWGRSSRERVIDVLSADVVEVDIAGNRVLLNLEDHVGTIRQAWMPTNLITIPVSAGQELQILFLHDGDSIRMRFQEFEPPTATELQDALASVRRINEEKQ